MNKKLTILLAFLALALTGCTSDKAGSGTAGTSTKSTAVSPIAPATPDVPATTAPPRSAAATFRACDLATAAQVSAIIGEAVTAKADAPNASVDKCDYLNSATRARNISHGVILVIHTERVPSLPGGSAKAYFEHLRSDPQVVASDRIDDIGDGAFYSGGGKTWYALSGNAVVTTQVLVHLAPDKARSLALLRQALTGR